MKCCRALPTLILCAWCAVAFPGLSYGFQPEQPPTFKASALLGRQLLSGPGYSIDDTVTNDGYMNTYVMHTPAGDLTVVSTALLRIRIAEAAAMQKMAQVAGGEEFGMALAGKGKQTLQGVANLVTDPLDTVGGALSGVGKMFARAHESLAESNPSQYEDSRVQGLIGYSQVKRDYAKQFGVDPYSTNPLLQKQLGDLASAGYAGSITGSALQALIPGGVGIAVSSVSGTAVLGEIDLTVPPTQLRMNNRASLTNMGVPEAVARLYINNAVFTPSQQTVIVKALEAMPGTSGKEDFVEFAATTDNQDVAFFRQRMAQMYAGYCGNVGVLSRFVPLDRFIGAQRADGTLVLAFPLDYLACTQAGGAIMQRLDAIAREQGMPGVELWLTGKASPGTKKLAKALRWSLRENAGEKLLGTPY